MLRRGLLVLAVGLGGLLSGGGAVGASTAPVAGWSPLALAVSHGAPTGKGSSVVAINTGTNQVVGTVLQNLELTSVAMAPNSDRAYVGADNYGPTHEQALIPIDLYTGGPVPRTAADLSSYCFTLNTMVIAPDGSVALLVCAQGIVEVNLGTWPPTPGPTITSPSVATFKDLVIAPDGDTAYVVCAPTTGPTTKGPTTSRVVPINLTTNPPTVEPAVLVGKQAMSMVISPNGATGYVSDIAGSAVYPIDLATDTVEAPIATDHPLGLALAPDGHRLYAVNNVAGSLTPISLTSTPPTASTAIPVGYGPFDDAVSPDGSRVFVANQAGSVSVVDTATDTVVATVPTGVGTTRVVVQPDQAPVASLYVGPGTVGQAVAMSAAGSTVYFGQIVSYAWNFGNGLSTTTTTNPFAWATYGRPGTYEVTVTETDSAGTSTTLVATGQTVLRNGSASATTTQWVTVGPACTAGCGVVGMAATPGGYWQVGGDGSVYAFGDARFDGSMAGQALDAPIVGIAATPTGGGYWEVAADGGVFAFGDAQFYGSMGGQALNAPIVGIAATPTGYWEVAADGGVFAFGNAEFYGSMGGQRLNHPIVGIAATAGGYWEVAADGGVFAFGSAQFYGSMGGNTLNAPVVGLAGTQGGYWEVAADGGEFSFGDANFYGAG